jgi:hypothetical protein
MTAAKRALATIWFIIGVTLAATPAIYLVTTGLHKAGLPTPAQAAGIQTANT